MPPTSHSQPSANVVHCQPESGRQNDRNQGGDIDGGQWWQNSQRRWRQTTPRCQICLQFGNRGHEFRERFDCHFIDWKNLYSLSIAYGSIHSSMTIVPRKRDGQSTDQSVQPMKVIVGNIPKHTKKHTKHFFELKNVPKDQPRCGMEEEFRR